MHEDTAFLPTAFLPTAFEDFTYRAQSDRKILVKIKALIAGIHRNGLPDGRTRQTRKAPGTIGRVPSPHYGRTSSGLST